MNWLKVAAVSAVLTAPAASMYLDRELTGPVKEQVRPNECRVPTAAGKDNHVYIPCNRAEPRLYPEAWDRLEQMV